MNKEIINQIIQEHFSELKDMTFEIYGPTHRVPRTMFGNPLTRGRLITVILHNTGTEILQVSRGGKDPDKR